MMKAIRKVLCVFSEEQEGQVRPALEAGRPAGVEFLWRRDGEEALAEVSSLQPDLIVVGTDLGPMEGIEFLAMHARAHPDSDWPVMVAPGPDDPFPPVVHRRDPASGRSVAVELERGDAAQRILEVVRGPSLEPTPPPEPLAPAPVRPESTPLARADVAPRPDEPSPALASANFEAVGEGATRGAPSVDKVAAPPPPSLLSPPSSLSRQSGRGAMLVGIIALLGAGVALTVYLAWPGGGQQRSAAAGSAQPRPGSAAEKPGRGPGLVVTRGPDAAAPAQKRQPASPVSAAVPERAILPITFARGSGQPSVEDAASLARLVAALKAEPDVRIEIGGHTSNEGSDEFNRRLGLARAHAAAKLLESRGVPASRLLPKSYAAREPVASNETEEGRSRNRRVTIRRLP